MITFGWLLLFLLCHLPFLADILIFLTLHLVLTSIRATSSYLYEELVATAIKPYAAVRDWVSAIGCESGVSGFG